MDGIVKKKVMIKWNLYALNWLNSFLFLLLSRIKVPNIATRMFHAFLSFSLDGHDANMQKL